MQMRVVVFSALFACISSVRVPVDVEDDEPEVQWDGSVGGATKVTCAGEMTIEKVRLPWLSMSSRVVGAKTLEQCKACGDDLQTRKILFEGWVCKKSWWRSRYWIKRKGENSMVHPRPKIASFNLTTDGLGPIEPAGAEFPEALRGVFWLTKQGVRSALMSFKGNGPDGKGGIDCKWCSTGSLIGNGYRLRVLGDSVWAMAIKERFLTSGLGIDHLFDMVYNFIFDDPKNPTYARILPVISRLWWGEALSRQGWFINFDMKLRTPEEAAEMGYPGSNVWYRGTTVFRALAVSGYDLVQVVDEHGNKIEPAWSVFMKYHMNVEETGDHPGVLFYRTDFPLKK